MPIPVALQLYSVRNTLRDDPWGTLEGLAALGFTHLEAANHHARTDPGVGFGVSASDLKGRLADLGLTIIGCHIAPLDLDILPAALDYQAELGNTTIGNDIEFFPYGDRDFVLRRAEQLDHIGRLAHERGMRFTYHNHFQEFQRAGDDLVYDLILDNTDPALVQIEFDTYWAYRAGQDAIAWMRRLGDRLILLHQKDFAANAPQPLNLYDGVVSPTETIDMTVFDDRKDPRCFTEIGTGTLPIQDIIDTAANLKNLDYLILEQDHTALTELDSVATSLHAFRRFTGIAW